ncbi:MAG: HAD family hydrolase [Methanomassiliicoccaceae archaeon]|nr:HAD family hydrolase [Methanomassiliicoccaceae archaeon]
MHERKFLAIGFDMDSTLLRTNVRYLRLREIAYEVMIEFGIPDGVFEKGDGSAVVVNKGLRYLMDHGREEDADDLMDHLNGRMTPVELENAGTARPYEGAEEMLEYLKNKGYKIGVLTRGSRRYAETALTVSGVIDELDALVCRDDFDELDAKPSPSAMVHLSNALGVAAKDVLYIGDNKIDWFCARDSGAGFIGVLTRYTKEDWTALGDILVIDTVADLVRIL